jgi:hypothetical protein
MVTLAVALLALLMLISVLAIRLSSLGWLSLVFNAWADACRGNR